MVLCALQVLPLIIAGVVQTGAHGSFGAQCCAPGAAAAHHAIHVGLQERARVAKYQCIKGNARICATPHSLDTP